MITRRKVKPKETKFRRVYDIEIGNFIVSSGDLIRVSGEHGGRFKFHSLVTNIETGVQWVDCFEVHKRSSGAWRSFRTERIKRIPVRRGKRVKNVV